MADGIYVGMTGAAARAEQLDSIADNLANIQTPGFKAARPAFESFLPAMGNGDKTYAAAVATGTDLRPGATTTTGNRLDIVPEDGAFLSVRTASGQSAFTRNGKLSVDADGQLRAGGHLVLGRSGGPIMVPPGAVPVIEANGSVIAGGTELDRLGLVQLNGPVDRLGNSLLTFGKNGIALPVDGKVRVGELELGNSNALEATVQLVNVQRHFDTSMQAIQTYRRLDERANEIGRVR